MIAPGLAWVCALAASSLVVQYVVKPRLPVYTIAVRGLPLPQWIQGQLQTRLTTQISLHNDNFVQIDVYALSFDLFYMDWDGQLAHIGNVRDQNQVVMRSNATKTLSEPVWRILPRHDFSITDYLYSTVHPWPIVKTLSRLLWSVWQGSGSLLLPTTGVAHIKASKAAPVTVTIVCDNRVDVFSLHVYGLDCVLKDLKPGWTNLTLTAATLRSYALKSLPGNAPGGVLPHPQRLSWNQIVNRVAVEEILQHP
jgi:hypothetical protein